MQDQMRPEIAVRQLRYLLLPLRLLLMNCRSGHVLVLHQSCMLKPHVTLTRTTCDQSCIHAKEIFKADPLGVVTSHRHPGFALGCFFRCLALWPEGLSCANLLAAASWATGCNIALDRGADPIKWCFTKAAARSAFQQVRCSQNSNARITGQEAW